MVGVNDNGNFFKQFLHIIGLFQQGLSILFYWDKICHHKKPSKDMNIKYVDLAEAEGEALVNEKTLQ